VVLAASENLQIAITEVRAELLVDSGSSPRGEAARHLIVQAYESLIQASMTSQLIQEQTLKIAACGGNSTCLSRIIDKTAALADRLQSQLLTYLSIRNAAIRTLLRKS